MVIIGITGTLGAGKGTVVEYLKEKGFAHFSANGFITEEIVRRGMPINRDSMHTVANDLRAKYSASYVIDELYQRAVANGKNCIIESIHTVAEAEALKKISGTSGGSKVWLIGVDADINVRYERIKKRSSEKDNVTYETFLKQQQDEMNSADPTKQNIAGAMKLANFYVTNNGTPEELREQVDEILKHTR